MQKIKKNYYILILCVIIACVCNMFFAGNLVRASEENKEDMEETINVPAWDGETLDTFELLDSTKSNSESNPYIIDTASKLAKLASDINFEKTYQNVYFKQTADINLGGYYEEDTFSGNMWTSIGYYSSSNSKVFRGIYDGGEYRIFNVANYSNEKSNSSFGLFGYTKGATLKNINLTINIKLDGSNIGGLVGYCEDTIIENCNVYSYISGNITNVGVLVGQSVSTTDITISNNYTNGIVKTPSGATNIAGLIGSVNSLDGTFEIEECSTGVSLNAYNVVGGITAVANGKVNITNCNSYSNIDANNSSNIGGIIAVNANAYIYGCKNSGIISSTGDNVGGIAGQSTGSIVNCSNYGSITGNDHVGGIVGTSKAIINNCSNVGKITGRNYIGGICGEVSSNDGTLIFEKNYNKGSVCGNTYVAGVVAYLKNVDMKYCFSVKNKSSEDVYQITGEEYVAGLVALVDNANIYCVFCTGNIKSKNIGAGLIANYMGESNNSTLEEFYFIGKVDGQKVAGIIQNLSHVTVANGYSVATLVSETSQVNYLYSGAVFGIVDEYISVVNVYFNVDTCSIGSAGNMVVDLSTSDTESMTSENFNQNISNFYCFYDEELQKDYYYDYYPTLRKFHFDVYNEECENYFINNIDIQSLAKYSVIAKTYETVRIIFETNCDTVLDDIYVKQNQDLTSLVKDVSKEGFVFKGWYLDRNLLVEADLNSGLTKSATLYARFDYPSATFPWWILVVIIIVLAVACTLVYVFALRKKTIIFKVEGLEISDLKLKIGSELKLPKPKKEGYKFNGWYYNQELTKKFDLDVMPNINLILFGEFKKIENESTSKNDSNKETKKNKSRTTSKSKEKSNLENNKDTKAKNVDKNKNKKE